MSLKESKNLVLVNESAESKLSKMTEKDRGYNDIASVPTPLKGSRKSFVNKTPNEKEIAPKAEDKRSLSSLN